MAGDVRLALKVLETEAAPRTTVKSLFESKADHPEWRERYDRVRPADREKLLALGEKRCRKQVAGYI